MLWEQILLARPVSYSELLVASSAVFGVPLDRVVITSRIEDAPPPGDRSVALILERRPVPGQFPLGVVIYVEAAECVEQFRERGAARRLLVRLSHALRTDVLISDTSPDPYTMLLIHPNGRSERVDLDGAALDERDAYQLAVTAQSRANT